MLAVVSSQTQQLSWERGKGSRSRHSDSSSSGSSSAANTAIQQTQLQQQSSSSLSLPPNMVNIMLLCKPPHLVSVQTLAGFKM